MAQRGHDGPEAIRRFLHPRLTDLQDPADLPGCRAAAQRLARAVREAQPVVVYGDYDVDGVTASAILWHTLRKLGHLAVTCYVPHRLDEGYGLNVEALETFAQSDPKPLVVTVDCGITAVAAAARAKELGLDLIITDHHQFDADDLPDAVALVHPELGAGGSGLGLGDADADDERSMGGRGSDRAGFPCGGGSPEGSPSPQTPGPACGPNPQTADSSCDPRPHPAGGSPPSPLCGAGVAFKLAWQTARTFYNTDRVPRAVQELLLDLTALAALGTVADVVPLTGENRVLVVHGLGRIKHTRFGGLNAMIDAAELRTQKVDAYHVGFVLGPRLNACGRMGHARQAVTLLTDASPTQAKELAGFLTDENDRRRQTERAILAEAIELVDGQGHAADDRRALVLAREGWHPGVIGIVASRLAERYHRPVVMLGIDPDTGEAKGSARSVSGVDLHAAISACSQHLDKFGGHAMAAGMTLAADNVDAFRDALVQQVNALLAPDDLAPRIRLDAEVDLTQCNAALFTALERMGPFGCANPAPRLRICGAITARPAQRMGAEGKHLTVSLRGAGGGAIRAVGFGLGDRAEGLPAGVAVDVAFKPSLNTWRGVTSPELHLLDIRPAERDLDRRESDNENPIEH